ncbi:hypothetical protein DTO027I6_9337 [Penicillium roqueforti]|uniref:uncharacterized protein n=1 Tax=Penicillium roqueforti TaxID=5082 RepID=UPI00190C0E0E|nr:uncharacterized protein LCP9604111_3238 [Penicillium roqueforti]KAF9250336.1 hypothetical protein LCP9604111_3238 [Penicillium roqueforti]KAI1833026.1 hypothetical protein CBS147337_5983 [Penicillium roqueforti]KAI2671313.1 hypothetical protein LCP963914a_9674 [Penicillium roqueforti]KAI2703370.1 hypothetical protein CBS147372_3685 [Penicillium roqueforti]KAI3097657.1 hypothetical protein CBS147333_9299 [Penicillium roqueforti]
MTPAIVKLLEWLFIHSGRAGPVFEAIVQTAASTAIIPCCISKRKGAQSRNARIAEAFESLDQRMSNVNVEQDVGLPGMPIEFPGTNHSPGTPDALLGTDQVIPETPRVLEQL